VSDVFVSIQVPHGKNGETYLRCVAADASGETIRKLVTEMCAKPSDFQIGSKRKVGSWKKPRKTAPVVKPEDDVIPGMEVDAKVEAAFT